MLASRCPVCNRKHNVVAVVAWPTVEGEKEWKNPPKGYGLIAVNADGDGCCSFEEGDYPTRAAADKAGAETDLAEIANEQECYDDDYGPVDSDPYDRETVYC